MKTDYLRDEIEARELDDGDIWFEQYDTNSYKSYQSLGLLREQFGE